MAEARRQACGLRGNLSTTSGTATQSVVNQVVGGLGAGLAVADHMLLMIRDLGVTTQAMFALTEWENSFSNPANANETMPLWGSVIDMGGETNVKRPQYLAEQLANSAILPTMLTALFPGPTHVESASEYERFDPARQRTLSAELRVYRRNALQCRGLQLKPSGALPVTFSGANAPTGSVLISQFTSTNMIDNNENLTSTTRSLEA